MGTSLLSSVCSALNQPNLNMPDHHNGLMSNKQK